MYLYKMNLLDFYYLFIFTDAHACAWVSLCALHLCRCPERAEVAGSPGVGVISRREPQMWMLGIEPAFSGKAANALSH